jgi:zinc transport system substrate-binding protein
MDRRRVTLGLLAFAASVPLSAADAKRLQIGITLHPYYSFVANLVGDRADVVPLIDAGFNPHNYTPRPQDMSARTG